MDDKLATSSRFERLKHKQCGCLKVRAATSGPASYYELDHASAYDLISEEPPRSDHLGRIAGGCQVGGDLHVLRQLGQAHAPRGPAVRNERDSAASTR